MKARQRMKFKSRNFPIYCNKVKKFRIRKKTEILHANFYDRMVVAVYFNILGEYREFVAQCLDQSGLWNEVSNGFGHFERCLPLKRISYWFYDREY